MPDDLKPVLARQMEVYAGFLEHTDHHVGRLIDALDGPRASSTTRSSTTSSATTAPPPRARSTACFNEIVVLNGAAGARDDRVHGLADRRLRHARRPTTTTRSAGRTRWTRRTSGPSRSPRTGAAPATARSCTGRTASRRKGEVRIAVPPRDRRRADGARGGRAARSRRSSTASSRCRSRASSMALLVRRRRRRRAARDAVLRDVLQPRHLPQGLDRGDPPQHAVGDATEMPPFDDDVWELYGPDDWTQAHDLAGEQPGEAAPSCSGCS